MKQLLMLMCLFMLVGCSTVATAESSLQGDFTKLADQLQKLTDQDIADAITTWTAMNDEAGLQCANGLKQLKAGLPAIQLPKVSGFLSGIAAKDQLMGGGSLNSLGKKFNLYCAAKINDEGLTTAKFLGQVGLLSVGVPTLP